MKSLLAIVIATATVLAGCASQSEPIAPVAPLLGPRAETVTTAYSGALRCLAAHVRGQSYAPPRIAVGLITDMTGAQDRDNGRRLTQGATLMAVTALSEAGVRLVERYDMGVLQVEMDYTRNGLVRDSDSVIREVRQGEIQGADLYLVGGISEFNPNIRSSGIDGFTGGTSSNSGSLSLGTGDYVVDVALDLRLVDARSSEILGVRSLRKQIVGREVRAGVFAFLDGTVVDIGGGQRAMEPVQTAVRTMVEQIVYEFVSALYSFNTDSCLSAAADEPAPAGTSGRGRLSPDLESPAVSAAPAPAPTAAPAPTPAPVAPPAPPAAAPTPLSPPAPTSAPAAERSNEPDLARTRSQGPTLKAPSIPQDGRPILISASGGPLPGLAQPLAKPLSNPLSNPPSAPAQANAGSQRRQATASSQPATAPLSGKRETSPVSLRGRTHEGSGLRRSPGE